MSRPVFVFFFHVFLGVSPQIQAAVFGVDDRLSISPNSPKAQLARSTAVGVLSSLVEESSPGKLKLSLDLAKNFLCEGERFASETSMPYACSGFLVAPDLLVTAGHCMVNFGEVRNEPEMYCEAYHWLFDYKLDASGRPITNEIPADNLRRCKQIIYAVSEDKPPYRDYALVQLDRPVTDRKPLRLSTRPLPLNSRLHMIGHPLGLPAKLSRNARVFVNNPERGSFITSLDANAGNSGSAVFNAQDEVVGILIGGVPSPGADLINDPVKLCGRFNSCREDGTGCKEDGSVDSAFPGFQGVGSEVQRIAPILELIRSLQ